MSQEAPKLGEWWADEAGIAIKIGGFFSLEEIARLGERVVFVAPAGTPPGDPLLAREVVLQKCLGRANDRIRELEAALDLALAALESAHASLARREPGEAL